jgi:hypothetical protein
VLADGSSQALEQVDPGERLDVQGAGKGHEGASR